MLKTFNWKQYMKKEASGIENRNIWNGEDNFNNKCNQSEQSAEKSSVVFIFQCHLNPNWMPS